MEESPPAPTFKHTCSACSLPITSQFIRSQKQHFHLECFKCLSCKSSLEQKFFNTETGPLCETCYFQSLHLICQRCEKALRGMFIKAGDFKFHVEHFSCFHCQNVFKPHDAYYEHGGEVYCANDYALVLAAKCRGCQEAVLTNFVMTGPKTGYDEESELSQWHPACYMLQKQWNIKMSSNQVEKVLGALYSFEESSAEAISSMLVSFISTNEDAGAVCALRLVEHVDLLFELLPNKEKSNSETNDSVEYKECKMIVKKIMKFFNQLTHPNQGDTTRTMIEMVSDIANVLKLLMRKILAYTLDYEPSKLDFVLNRLHQFTEEGHTVFNCTKCKLIMGKYSFFQESGPMILKCSCGSEITASSSTECPHNRGSLPPEIYMVLLCQSMNNLLVELGISPNVLIRKEEVLKQETKQESYFDHTTEGLAREPTIRRNTVRGVKWSNSKEQYITDINGLSSVSLKTLAKIQLEKYFSPQILQKAVGGMTFWQKMFRKSTTKVVDSTFGSPLELLLKNYGTSSTLGYGMTAVRIPIIVHEIIQQLISEPESLRSEGIFRKNGNIRRLKELVIEIDEHPRKFDFHDDGAIQTAALLKKFLRDLPEPLLTAKLYEMFVAIPGMKLQDEEKAQILKFVILLLPKPNIDLLGVLLKFLGTVAANSSENKMDPRNLATVIAPNILYTEQSETAPAIEVVRIMIEHGDMIFKTNEIVSEYLKTEQKDGDDPSLYQ